MVHFDSFFHREREKNKTQEWLRSVSVPALYHITTKCSSKVIEAIHVLQKKSYCDCVLHSCLHTVSVELEVEICSCALSVK